MPGRCLVNHPPVVPPGVVLFASGKPKEYAREVLRFFTTTDTVTAKAWSKLSRPYKLDVETPKAGIGISLPGQRIRWMKAHLQQTGVDPSRVTADDLHGNGQADVFANQGTATHGTLEPDVTWTRWADFADKVFHFWRLVSQLRERREDEPRVKLQAELLSKPLIEVPIKGRSRKHLSRLEITSLLYVTRLSYNAGTAVDTPASKG
eukprot:2405802-Amphidinium_carterae.1